MSRRDGQSGSLFPVDGSPINDRQKAMKQQALYASLGVQGSEGHRSIFVLKADNQASDEEHAARRQLLHDALYQTLLNAATMLHIPTRNVPRSLIIGTGDVRMALTYCDATFIPIDEFMAQSLDRIQEDFSAVLQRIHDEFGLPIKPLKDYEITQRVRETLVDPTGPFAGVLHLLEAIGHLAPLTDRVLASSAHPRSKPSKKGGRNDWNLATGFLARYNASTSSGS